MSSGPLKGVGSPPVVRPYAGTGVGSPPVVRPYDGSGSKNSSHPSLSVACTGGGRVAEAPAAPPALASGMRRKLALPPPRTGPEGAEPRMAGLGPRQPPLDDPVAPPTTGGTSSSSQLPRSPMLPRLKDQSDMAGRGPNDNGLGMGGAAGGACVSTVGAWGSTLAPSSRSSSTAPCGSRGTNITGGTLVGAASLRSCAVWPSICLRVCNHEVGNLTPTWGSESHFKCAG